MSPPPPPLLSATRFDLGPSPPGQWRRMRQQEQQEQQRQQTSTASLSSRQCTRQTRITTVRRFRAFFATIPLSRKPPPRPAILALATLVDTAFQPHRPEPCLTPGMILLFPALPASRLRDARPRKVRVLPECVRWNLERILMTIPPRRPCNG